MSEFSTRLAMYKHTASQPFNCLPAPTGDGYAADEAKSLDNAEDLRLHRSRAVAVAP